MTPDERGGASSRGRRKAASTADESTPSASPRSAPQQPAVEPGTSWRPARRPMQTVPRQFRLLPEEDDLVVQLHQYLGDDKMVESMRRFIRHCVPMILDGRIVVPPSDRRR